MRKGMIILRLIVSHIKSATNWCDVHVQYHFPSSIHPSIYSEHLFIYFFGFSSSSSFSVFFFNIHSFSSKSGHLHLTCQPFICHLTLCVAPHPLLGDRIFHLEIGIVKHVISIKWNEYERHLVTSIHLIFSHSIYLCVPDSCSGFLVLESGPGILLLDKNKAPATTMATRQRTITMRSESV